MNFGEPSPNPVETADCFSIVRAIMAPPPPGIGLNGTVFICILETIILVYDFTYSDRGPQELSGQLVPIFFKILRSAEV